MRCNPNTLRYKDCLKCILNRTLNKPSRNKSCTGKESASLEELKISARSRRTAFSTEKITVNRKNYYLYFNQIFDHAARRKLFDINIRATTFANCAGLFTTFAENCLGIQAAD